MDNVVKKLHRCVAQIKLKADFKDGHILKRELPLKKNDMVSSLPCLQSKVFSQQLYRDYSFILLVYGEHFDHSGKNYEVPCPPAFIQ